MNSVMLIQFAVMIICVVIFQTVMVNYNKLIKARNLLDELTRLIDENTAAQYRIQGQLLELEHAGTDMSPESEDAGVVQPLVPIDAGADRFPETEQAACEQLRVELAEHRENIRLCRDEYNRIAEWVNTARTRGVTKWIAGILKIPEQVPV